MSTRRATIDARHTARSRHSALAPFLSGWGQVPRVPGLETRSEDLTGLSAHGARLARGLGRAYGDAALPAPHDFHVIGTSLADRVIQFDENEGVLLAEAGLSLDRLASLSLRRGFFVPVSPGTRFVTLGGMVACDVHGKNHHVAGSIGNHIRRLTVRVPDGRIVKCSPLEEADLFWATIGGMGLTGAVLDVELSMTRIPSRWIWEEREAVSNIDLMIDGLRNAARQWPMTVAWIDCLASGSSLGRGVIIKGRWASAEEAPSHEPPRRPMLSLPFDMPRFVLSSPAVRAFNAMHYWAHRVHTGARVVHPYTFFYPLDGLHNWRRLYGEQGFVQYQCVLPYPDVTTPARAILALLNRGLTSFLCIVKDCGEEGLGLLSFPKPGISIALDIPYRGSETQTIVDEMNRAVIAAGGRIYLAKDALTRAEHFAAMESRLPAFLAAREKWDPNRRLRSAQSVRLLGW